MRNTGIIWTTSPQAEDKEKTTHTQLQLVGFWRQKLAALELLPVQECG